MDRSKRWLILVVLYTAMLIFALSYQSIPPVLGVIMSDLHLSHGQAGSLMSMYALPGIIISIPAGMLADIYGYRRVGLISMALAILGSLLVALSSDFLFLAGARIVTGVGGMAIAVIIPPALSKWFQTGELGIAMGILNTAMPLGTTLAFNMFGWIGYGWGWQIPILLTAAAGAVSVTAFYITYPRDKREPGGTTGEKLSIRKAVSQVGSPVWLAAGVWAAYNASVLSYLTFAPDYYGSLGLSPGYASFLASLFMIGSLAAPAVGYLIGKVNSPELLMAGGNIVVAALLLIIFYALSGSSTLGLALGIAGSLVPAPVFALVPQLVVPERRGLAFGIVSSCMNIGAAIGPFFVGRCYDLTASYSCSFLIMVIFALTGAVLALRLKAARR